eukprot:1644575-Rhodomonas_salina.1
MGTEAREYRREEHESYDGEENDERHLQQLRVAATEQQPTNPSHGSMRTREPKTRQQAPGAKPAHINEDRRMPTSHDMS